jgi:hypothetical protein
MTKNKVQISNKIQSSKTEQLMRELLRRMTKIKIPNKKKKINKTKNTIECGAVPMK